MAIVEARPFMDVLGAPMDLSNFGSLLHAAENQQARQMRTLVNLQKQAEQQADANLSYVLRQQARQEKLAQIDMERQVQKQERDRRTAEVEANRQARLAAAARHEEAMRAAAEAKVQAVNNRLERFAEERAQKDLDDAARAAQSAQRRDTAYATNLQIVEARRQAGLAREQRVDELLHQREELRQLQLQIKAEEDYVREQARQAAKARADAELASRVGYFQAKQDEKQSTLMRRQQELDHLRRVKADEARQRSEYIAFQATEAAAVDAANRQALAARIASKVARADQVSMQRERLMEEMKLIRQQMQIQEEAIRTSLTRMRQKGSLALPEPVARTLSTLLQGGPLRSTVSINMLQGPGSGSPAGRPLLLEASPSAGRTPASGARRNAPKLLTASYSGGSFGASAGAGTGASRRRPQSAGASGPPRYLTAMATVGAFGSSRTPAGKGAGAGGRPGKAGARPMSASVAAAVRTRTGVMTAAAEAAAGAAAASVIGSPVTETVPGTVPAMPYATRRARAAYDGATSPGEVAGAAVQSGRYTTVSEVAKPGARREEELRQVLQEEIKAEGERQAMLAKVVDDSERARLIKLYALEREEAKKRILSLSAAAQAHLYH